MAVATRHPELLTAAEYLQEGKPGLAEPLVRELIKRQPTDVSAIRLLADISIKLNRYEDAKNLLERVVQLAPDYKLARNNYTAVLLHRQELTAALTQINILLDADPDNARYLILKGSILVRMGDHSRAIAIFETVLREHPEQAPAQLSYGHALKTVGRVAESIAAYRAPLN